jgi:catechol 2,3-dioxygenase-like lactoylglutathione lyase family enzyme
MRWLVPTLSLAVLSTVVPSRVQLPASDEANVTMGHLHLNVQGQNLELHKRFWIGLGATPTRQGPFDVMKLPGVNVFLNLPSPSDPPVGGSVGSVVNHVGFKVRNVQELRVKWDAMGLRTAAGQSPQQSFVFTPDDLRIEILEDPSLTVPIVFHHIHFFVGEHADSVAEIKAWYVKIFGAIPGMRGQNEAADLPGVNLTFSKSPTPTVGTKGRVLDHIAFEVKDLEAFCMKLEASGVKFEVPYTRSATGLGSAFLTDPWGTYIELDERLNRL